MLMQLRLDYPEAEVISELLSIHDSKYVVRVLIKINGKILASALAAAETVELAEDQARLRAYHLLKPTPKVAITPPSASAAPIVESQPTTSIPETVPARVEPPAVPPLNKPQTITPVVPQESQDDLSDLIAAINLQMTRLNWTKEQGKDYLLQTYGKKSRHLLSDAELLEFLDYLKLQPDPL